MSKTLLEMVQDIVNDLDDDPVNSIDDTPEAEQIAQIVRTTCEELVSSRNWENFKALTNLTGLGDTSNPTKMRIPDSVLEIEWVKYNGEDVTYLPPYQFKTMLFNREELTGVVDSNGYVLNRDPIYYTTYDGIYLYFDGYDSDTENSLQTSNSTVFGQKALEWTHTDGFTPAIPEKMFPVLLADAKSTAFLVLKQQVNQKEEAKARRGRTRLQSENYRIRQARHVTGNKVNYGRK